ncbi:MAG: prepilin-type N-terminal cleavage/methylation domain-containing protein [Planctomycetota bacterium]
MSRNRTPHLSGAGFTLIEMIVVIAIIISLAGVIVPVISGELEDAKQARAVADVNRIATAIGQYIKDTGYLPTGNKGQDKYHWLYSYGDQPSSNDFASGPGTHLRRFLEMNDFGGKDWKGPYAGDIGPDPWGRAYIVNVHGYGQDDENVLVLCAGPNGEVDTHPSATQAGGDDIVILID